MGICRIQLRDLISRVLIKFPEFHSDNAITLLMMTAATESDLGKYLYQTGGGPARGIMQVEIPTMRDNYTSYLDYRIDLKKRVEEVTGASYPRIDFLESNIAFNIVMARIKYYRSPGALPSTLEGMAMYHEKFYNAGGAADWEVTMAKYKHFCT